MNLFILYGKVINNIDLQFIYNCDKKTLGEKLISIVEIELKLQDSQIVKLHAYNEMADRIYQKVKEGDYILIKGKVRSKFLEIEEVQANIELKTRDLST